MSRNAYEVRETTVTARPVAGVRTRIRRGSLATEFVRHLDLVYAAGKAGVASLDGQNIFIYGAAAGDDVDVAFCVGASAPFVASGPVEPLSTPDGVAAVTTHIGEYRHLGDAHAAIHSWCRERQRVGTGVSWEVYGHWHPDPALCRTDVYYLLEG
ncbi:MAG: GyrI-like domain-containing protein [Gemmatimonadetes bacterium]|nr:GyrI-like domain-containing protein [Gemmatimonadota bacterium]